MKNETLYNSFLERIAQSIPRKTDVVTILAKMLNLSKDSVYRRLKGEVPFTFYEVIEISARLGISLDNLDVNKSSQSKPFTLSLIEYINPVESDFALMDEMTAIMKSFRNTSDPEAGEITNILPQPLYIPYKYVFRFYLFKWNYQSSRSQNTLPYKEIVIPDKLQKSKEEYLKWAKRLHADYIFDRQILQYIINDIKYFYYIGLITVEEIELIKQDLLKIVDEIDTLTHTGVIKETGKKINIYISEVNIDTNYISVSAPDYQLTIIKAFLLNGIASTDKATFEEVRSWMQSMKQQSVLITRSNEKERLNYLREQRRIIDGLSGL